ncbi:MAG: hypothetical protein R2706_15515 [Acidimicrobiales bacterium]
MMWWPGHEAGRVDARRLSEVRQFLDEQGISFDDEVIEDDDDNEDDSRRRHKNEDAVAIAASAMARANGSSDLSACISKRSARCRCSLRAKR